MLEPDRSTLLARAIYALSGLNAANLAAEVERIERASSLRLPTEALQGQEDAVADLLGGTAPQAGHLDGGGTE